MSEDKSFSRTPYRDEAQAERDTEDDYLSRQASDAKAAIRRTAGELLDVRTHVCKHPWWAVGAACMAGIATGRATRKRVRRSAEADDCKPARRKTLLSTALATALSEGVKFLLPTLFSGALLAKTAQIAEREDDKSD